MPPADIKILTLHEVAHKLGISYPRARVLVLYDEKIPSFKVGSRGIRVREQDLENYITKQQVEKSESTERPDTREVYPGRQVLGKEEK